MKEGLGPKEIRAPVNMHWKHLDLGQRIKKCMDRLRDSRSSWLEKF
jgi:hypothetical protein